MTENEAADIVEILAEAFPRPEGVEWTAAKVKLWVAAIIDLAAVDTREAVMNWIRGEKWMPKPSEIRELAALAALGRAERARVEAATTRGLPAGAVPQRTTPTPAQLHLWRAATGKPVKGCYCESCQAGRKLLDRENHTEEKPRRGPEIEAEVERVGAWAEQA